MKVCISPTVAEPKENDCLKFKVAPKNLFFGTERYINGAVFPESYPASMRKTNRREKYPQ